MIEVDRDIEQALDILYGPAEEWFLPGLDDLTEQSDDEAFEHWLATTPLDQFEQLLDHLADDQTGGLSTLKPTA
jgi:hypothetical protein